MRRWLKRTAVFLGVGVLVWSGSCWLLRSEPVEVRAHRVSAGLVEETVTNSRAGSVKARRRSRLSPELGGQALAIPFREGARVKAGDVVLRLDDSLQRARLELARRELEAARAQEHQTCLSAERAEQALSRTANLAQEAIVSTDLLDEATTAARTAEAACVAGGAGAGRAEAAVVLAEAELAKTVLRAPFGGIVAEVSIEVGEWTTPSPPALPVPPVIDLLDPRSIYISAPMDEVDAARLRPGQAVRVTVDSHRGEVFNGTVSRVAVYVLDLEAQNRTVDVEVELDEEQAAVLLPGTSADVEVILSRRVDVPRLPTSAIFEGSKALVVEDGYLAERSLDLGLRNWNFTEVKSGVSEGELVVFELDRSEIQPGAPVRVAEVTEASEGISSQ